LQRSSTRERSRWARRALDWPLVKYLEGAVWLGVAVTLAVSYYGSYDNLVEVLMALGYAIGPARVVPIALDAPLTVSVIGQFLLARWKSPAVKRWRLFAVTIITAPLSLAGNALRGALVFDGPAGEPGRLDLALLDLHRPEVWIRLIAAMVPSIGVILAVAVTELVLREHARLEELREAGAQESGPPSPMKTPVPDPGQPSAGREPTSAKRDARHEPEPRTGQARSRRSADEVLALVRGARERLTGELEREPGDEEIAARMTAGGHRITASRVRTYLGRLRAEERAQPAPETKAEEEVLAWHSR